MKGTYNENFRPLKNEIEEDNRRCKNLPFLWIGRMKMAKMILSKNPTISYTQIL